MGKKVDHDIKSVMKSGKSKGSAIAILKAQGTIHQSGKHLALGPKKGKK